MKGLSFILCKTDYSQHHSEASSEYMHRLLELILKVAYEQEASIT